MPPPGDLAYKPGISQTGNQTSNPLHRSLVLNPLSPTSQGLFLFGYSLNKAQVLFLNSVKFSFMDYVHFIPKLLPQVFLCCRCSEHNCQTYLSCSLLWISKLQETISVLQYCVHLCLIKMKVIYSFFKKTVLLLLKYSCLHLPTPHPSYPHLHPHCFHSPLVLSVCPL